MPDNSTTLESFSTRYEVHMSDPTRRTNSPAREDPDKDPEEEGSAGKRP